MDRPAGPRQGPPGAWNRLKNLRDGMSEQIRYLRLRLAPLYFGVNAARQRNGKKFPPRLLRFSFARTVNTRPRNVPPKKSSPSFFNLPQSKTFIAKARLQKIILARSTMNR